MRIIRFAVISIVSVAFPLLIAVNCYLFLIELNPSLNFLGVEMSAFNNKQQFISEYCRYGGVTYFGLTSLKSFLTSLSTDNMPQVIRGLANSFYTANFAGPASMPTMANISDNATIIQALKLIYIVISYAFQPLVALGWLLYAIGLFAGQVTQWLDIITMALGGHFASIQCYTYPQV